MIHRPRRGVEEEVLVSELSSLERVVVIRLRHGFVAFVRIVLLVFVLVLRHIRVQNRIVLTERTQRACGTILTLAFRANKLFILQAFLTHGVARLRQFDGGRFRRARHLRLEHGGLRTIRLDARRDFGEFLRVDVNPTR